MFTSSEQATCIFILCVLVLLLSIVVVVTLPLYTPQCLVSENANNSNHLVELVLLSLSEKSPQFFLDDLQDSDLFKAFLSSFWNNAFTSLAFRLLLLADFSMQQSGVLWVQEGPLFFLQYEQDFLGSSSSLEDSLLIYYQTHTTMPNV